LMTDKVVNDLFSYFHRPIAKEEKMKMIVIGLIMTILVDVCGVFRYEIFYCLFLYLHAR
jgi:hypothetical protein